MLTPWYARERFWEDPFPWLGLLLFTAALLSGAVIVPVLAWLGFELIDQNLESWTP